MAEAEGVVVVRGGGDGFVQEIDAGRHHLVADEPVGAGGTDRGPGPYDLLMAALGACMSMTIALYARRKQWPLETVVIRLSHSRVYAKDCLECVVRDDTRQRLGVAESTNNSPNPAPSGRRIGRRSLRAAATKAAR